MNLIIKAKLNVRCDRVWYRNETLYQKVRVWIRVRIRLVESDALDLEPERASV